MRLAISNPHIFIQITLEIRAVGFAVVYYETRFRAG
jgi:hypothetical protein